MKTAHSWFDAPTVSRFTTPDAMKPGDIAERLPDGRFFIVGTGGQFRKPSPWDRLLAWLGR